MSQETNLNVSPYFDDFDVDKNYYKVLFKPGVPVQARELTTLQSILQDQIEKFGNHIFKDGSVVIPGQLLYDNPFPAIEVESEFNGLPISLYFEELINVTVKGLQSGVTARILYTLNNIESERNNYTIYVKYLESGGSNRDIKTFLDGETLILQKEDGLSYGLNNLLIQNNQGILNTISLNCNSQASSVRIMPGVYFIRGYFVNVDEQRILLDQYDVTPTYKVGFEVVESVVNADEDDTLYDNARGFNNYAAPGADRFKIDLILSKKDINDYESNFVEIFRVNDGIPTYSVSQNSQYNIIRDELAKRTFEESGDYVVKPFRVTVRESLNNSYNLNGVFSSDSLTVDGNVPSEKLMLYQVEPGKAYVKGYDNEIISTRYLDVEKPRTTDTVTNLSLNFNAGTVFVLDNTSGVPPIGIGRTELVELRDSRIGINSSIGYGNTIGLARVYDYVPESSYENNTSRMLIRLFDIETYTNVGLNTTVTLTTPCRIKGKSSNATGFIKNSVTNSTTLTLYSVSGQFLDNERIEINGVDSNKLITSIRDYSLEDVKSIYSSVGINTFNSDTALSTKKLILPLGTDFQITGNSAGISTVSSSLQFNFNNILKEGDIISYSLPSSSQTQIYNRVVNVSTGGTNFTVTGVTTVSGICDGRISSSPFTVTNIVKITPEISNRSNGLLTVLPDLCVSSVDVRNSRVLQRRLFDNVSFSNNTLSVSITEDELKFATFDEDRYLVSFYNGKTEVIRSDKFLISPDSKTITFSDLSVSSGSARVIGTVENIAPNPKIKKLNKVNSLIINKSSDERSGIGTTTLNDALTYSQIYGIRVQDEEISLNVPDVLKVLAIYESSGINDPQIPKIQLTSFTGSTNSNLDYQIGEIIRGDRSNAVGIIVSRVNSDELEFVYLNTFQFIEGELIVGEQTSTNSIIVKTYIADKNITNNYTLNDGQNIEFYDYSRIIRKKSISAPKRKIKIIFQNYYIDSNDTGEFFTVNSYSNEDYTFNIPYLGSIRRFCSDIIDIRPRVSPYQESSNLSPFESGNKILSFSTRYSSYNIVPDDNLLVTYNYYLPRVDKVILNKDGTLEVIKGVPNTRPVAPPDSTNSITLATIFNNPYIRNSSKETVVSQNVLKRYRMSDISLLEDRIKRLENYTSLSLSEIRTESLTIKDAETGLDRFKCGFFVENFSSTLLSATLNKNFKCSFYNNKGIPIVSSKALDLELGSEAIPNFTSTYNSNADRSFIEDLGSPGVKKTGDLVTLNYDSIKYAEQPLSSKTDEPGGYNFWKGYVSLLPSSDNWYEPLSVESSDFKETSETLIVLDKYETITKEEINNVPVYVSRPTPVTQPITPRYNSAPKPSTYTRRKTYYIPVKIGTTSSVDVYKLGGPRVTFGSSYNNRPYNNPPRLSAKPGTFVSGNEVYRYVSSTYAYRFR